MHIDISSIDKDNFSVKESELAGDKIYLVNPIYMGCQWNKDNIVFRSSIWNDHELISAGFPKFVNWGELLELFPIPESIKNCSLVNKVDGSCLIISKYKGQFIFRTRGTFDAKQLENGYEIDMLMKKYPEILEFMNGLSIHDTCDFSLIFEWVSPKNKIIINYGDEPDLYLIGGINHEDYSLFTQMELDELSLKINVKRPQRYQFKSFSDMIDEIKDWKGTEGVVVYSNNDQTLHKVKSQWYLALHHLKSEINSIEKLIDIWMGWNKPNYNDMYSRIKDTFDFELAEQVRGNISKILDANKEVMNIIDGMNNFIERIKTLPTRKEQALEIMDSYGKGTSRSGIVFNLLDGRKIENDGYKKLMIQILNK